MNTSSKLYSHQCRQAAPKQAEKNVTSFYLDEDDASDPPNSRKAQQEQHQVGVPIKGGNRSGFSMHAPGSGGMQGSRLVDSM